VRFFVNRAALRQLSDDDEVLHVTRDHYFQLVPSDPVNAFLGAACHLSGMVARISQFDVKMKMFRYFFAGGKAREEALEFSRLVDTGESPGDAAKAALELVRERARTESLDRRGKLKKTVGPAASCAKLDADGAVGSSALDAGTSDDD